MINLDYTRHAVKELRRIHAGLFELVAERSGLEFCVGDCVALCTENGQSRPYSIASGTGESELRFLIRRMDGGEVSPWLADRRPGDMVRISPPFGWFRPGQEIGNAPFVFFATGTGMAPFLSYLHTFPKPPDACLYGVRREADAAGFSDFCRFCPTQLAVSREPTTRHHAGRITDLLHAVPLADETHYYACGLESMVNEVSAWLLENGVALGKIHREVFFHG